MDGLYGARLTLAIEILGKSKIGIAVSGGPDSMALAALASKAFGKERVHAFIVDHQLESAGVTESPGKVCDTLRELGIASSVLKLEWPVQLPNETRLMIESREKRYRALLDACNEEGISVLLTGHNLEDDLVTMFYRISHQSGLDGIAGMKAATNFPFPAPNAANCFILRPLLEIPKARLVETCRSLNVPWTHDQSNDNLNFRRNETLEALIKLQSENEAISTEALSEMLGFFKRQRKFLFDKGKRSAMSLFLALTCFLVSNAMASSVIVNQSVGDATVILNNKELTENKYLFTRVLGNLVQIVTANPYPAKTPSLNRVYDEVYDSLKKYEAEAKKERSARRAFTLPQQQSQPPIKRLDFPQHTLANATVYALSKNDSLRRIDNFMHRSGRKLVPGPALLIQREIPPRKDKQALSCTLHDFAQGSLLWDSRLFLKCSGPSGSMNFSIRPLNAEIVKEFEAATKGNMSARRNLYAYLGMTPASHLHIIPVLKHLDSGYMALPTLNCYSDPVSFKWTVSNAATGIMAGKFLCIP